MSIAIFTLTSELHQEALVMRDTQQFFDGMKLDFTWCHDDFSTYGTHPLEIIFVRTGGTEGLFLRMLPMLRERSRQPFYLLTSGKSNSLAASMEILAYLQQQGLRGEIIHGSKEQIVERLHTLERVGHVHQQLCGSRLATIGKPSDWLIASLSDAETLKRKADIELVDIPMKELLQCIPPQAPAEEDASALPGALAIYEGLKTLVERYRLDGFTLRCFDLLTAVHNTGCLALAKLNAEGIVAGCEGDVPAMLTMRICQALTGTSGFQANPARIDTQKDEILFAHCTIPLNMVHRYEYDTHFESGIGVAISGEIEEGPVTVCKVSADLSRWYVQEGELIRCQHEQGLCRTQMLLHLPQTDYFLTRPIGNHHVIVKGRHKEVFEELMQQLS